MTTTARTITAPDLVGPKELVELFGVSRSWVDTLRWKGELLEPFAVVSGHPVWIRADAVAWWQARQDRIAGREDTP